MVEAMRSTSSFAYSFCLSMASRIADDGAVAEHLRHQLDVRRLAATRARARELKQRLEQLRVLHLRVRDLFAPEFWNRQEVLPVLVVLLANRRLRFHVDGLVLGLALALRRAHRHA